MKNPEATPICDADGPVFPAIIATLSNYQSRVLLHEKLTFNIKLMIKIYIY